MVTSSSHKNSLFVNTRPRLSTFNPSSNPRNVEASCTGTTIFIFIFSTCCP
uniref:Uncharacterized protein n=1 Tax=Rhizophora mucronata TaxID=61149 RepID=A0A2P2NNV1_RHIMU